MRRTALLLLAATAAALPGLKVKAERLPVVTTVTGIRRPTPFQYATVELDAKGRLYLGGSRATLHEVDAFVLRTTEERSTFNKRKGKPGYDTLPSGMTGSNVEIHLRIDRDAPWRHVQWLLSVLGAQRAYKTEFVARDRAGSEGVVKVWLPFDEAEAGGIDFAEGAADETTKAPKPKKNTVTVTLIAEGIVPIKFAGRPANGPRCIAYAVGKRKTKERDKFEGWMRDDLRNKKTLEIRAHGKVPFHEVMAVVDVARAGGHERIDLYRAAVPTRAQRALKQLPYPK